MLWIWSHMKNNNNLVSISSVSQKCLCRIILSEDQYKEPGDLLKGCLHYQHERRMRKLCSELSVVESIKSSCRKSSLTIFVSSKCIQGVLKSLNSMLYRYETKSCRGKTHRVNTTLFSTWSNQPCLKSLSMHMYWYSQGFAMVTQANEGRELCQPIDNNVKVTTLQ